MQHTLNQVVAGTVVEYMPHFPEVEGSSPVTVTDIRKRERIGRKELITDLKIC
jgi:hypothetical protein